MPTYEVWGHDAFSGETFLVGGHATRRAAELQADERRAATRASDPDLADRYWVAAAEDVADVPADLDLPSSALLAVLWRGSFAALLAPAPVEVHGRNGPDLATGSLTLTIPDGADLPWVQPPSTLSLTSERGERIVRHLTLTAARLLRDVEDPDVRFLPWIAAPPHLVTRAGEVTPFVRRVESAAAPVFERLRWLHARGRYPRRRTT